MLDFVEKDGSTYRSCRKLLCRKSSIDWNQEKHPHNMDEL